MAAPTLVAAYVSPINPVGGAATLTSPSLSLQPGDIVTVLAMGAGANNGDHFNTPATTLTNGGITALKTHSGASDCPAGAWTFTVGGTGTQTGTVSVTTVMGGANTDNSFNFAVVAHRGATAPTATTSALGASSGMTVAYTASQADSAIAWIFGDWNAGAIGTVTPTSTSHSTSSPGPTALPQSAVLSGQYTENVAVLDDQTSTASVSYGVTGTSSTGPFTIIVVEVPAAAGGPATVSGAATLAAVSSLGATVTVTVIAADTMAATSSLGAPATLTRNADATLAASSSLGAPATLTRNAADTMAATSSLGAAVTDTVLAADTMAATSSLGAAATDTVLAADTMAATSSLSASASGIGTQSGAATLAATSSLSAPATLTRNAADTMAATSSLFASANGLQSGAATMAATSALSGTGTVTKTGADTMAAHSALAAPATLTVANAASLAAQSSLSAAAELSRLGVATITATSSFSATAQAFNPSGFRDLTITTTALGTRWTITPLTPKRWTTVPLGSRWTTSPIPPTEE